MMGLVPGGQYQLIKLHDLATGTGNGITLYLVDATLGAASIAGFQVDGITNATITWELTIDNDQWHAILAENITTGVEATTATADGIYRITVLGAGLFFRARISAYVGGIITVTALVTP